MADSPDKQNQSDLDELIKKVYDALSDKDLSDAQVSIQIVDKQRILANWRMFASPRDIEIKR